MMREARFWRSDSTERRLIGLDQQVAEHVLQHTDHRALVDILKLFELRKSAYQIEVVHNCNLF